MAGLLENTGNQLFGGGGPPPGTSLNDLAGQDSDAQRRLLAMLAQYNQQYNQAFQAQSNVARGYDAVIAGTAPSVAQGQLQQGVGQIAQQQQAQASGATGTNAAIARVAAMQNTAQAQTAANQQAAMLRATETDQARRAQAGIAAQQAGEAGGMYATNVSGATGFAAPAGAAASSAASIKQKEDEATRAFWANMVKSVGSAAAAGGA